MATSSSKIDILIKSGIGNDKNITFYRKVLLNPKTSPNDPSLRNACGIVLDKAIEFILNDQITYNRFRNFLLKQRSSSLRKPITEAALNSLINKSIEKDIPLEIIEEVYCRGYDETYDNPQNKAFDRVNSFLSGGKALEMDKNLIEQYYESNSPKKVMLEETKPIVNNTLRTIQKTIRRK